MATNPRRRLIPITIDVRHRYDVLFLAPATLDAEEALDLVTAFIPDHPELLRDLVETEKPEFEFALVDGAVEFPEVNFLALPDGGSDGGRVVLDFSVAAAASAARATEELPQVDVDEVQRLRAEVFRLKGALRETTEGTKPLPEPDIHPRTVAANGRVLLGGVELVIPGAKPGTGVTVLDYPKGGNPRGVSRYRVLNEFGHDLEFGVVAEDVIIPGTWPTPTPVEWHSPGHGATASYPPCTACGEAESDPVSPDGECPDCWSKALGPQPEPAA